MAASSSTLTRPAQPYWPCSLPCTSSVPSLASPDQRTRTETFSIRFDAQDPECGFVTESTIDGLRELHLLCGSTLVTRHPDDDGALSLWDLSDLRHEKLHMLNPSLVQVSPHPHSLAHAHASQSPTTAYKPSTSHTTTPSSYASNPSRSTPPFHAQAYSPLAEPPSPTRSPSLSSNGAPTRSSWLHNTRPRPRRPRSPLPSTSSSASGAYIHGPSTSSITTVYYPTRHTTWGDARADVPRHRLHPPVQRRRRRPTRPLVLHTRIHARPHTR